MDFFKFTADPPTDLSNGLYFGGYDSATWVERYRDPGSFEFKAPLSSGLREALPLGTIISHTNTLEAAIVENHEIEEERISDPQLKISGRTIDIFLLQRIVGMELAWNDPVEPYTPYVLSPATVAQQIKTLINDHIVIANLNDANNSLDDNIVADAIAGSGATETRELKRRNVHAAVMELLNVANLGIKVIRKNPFGVHGSATQTLYYVHGGVDRSNEVVFDWEQGEIDNAKYLFSNKALKNTALVHGKFLEEIVYTAGQDNIDRRILLVDGSEIDDQYSDLAQPWPQATRDLVLDRFRVLGEQALANQKVVDIASVDISETTNHTYRVDYNIGDIVSVTGNYDTTAKRRVVEHVEIEDKNGAKSYPTLAALEE